MNRKHTNCARNTIYLTGKGLKEDWQHCPQCCLRVHAFSCGAFDNAKLRNKDKDCFCDKIIGKEPAHEHPSIPLE